MNTTPAANFYGSNPYYPSCPTPSYIPTSTFQPNVQASLINGRPVDSLEEITPGEVPLNGSLALFPKKDGSVVYVKSMNANGTIDTKRYVPAPDDFVDNPGSDSHEQDPPVSNRDLMLNIMNLQDNIGDLKKIMNEQFSRKNKNYSRSNNQNGSREKVEDNA